MLIRRSAILSLTLLIAGQLWGWDPRTVEDLVPPHVIRSYPEFLQGEGITATIPSSRPDFMPQGLGLEQDLIADLPLENARIAIEGLRLVSISDDASSRDTIDELTVYNILRAISRMEGIEYYSERRNRMRVLFEVSHRIPGPDDRAYIEDEQIHFIPTVDTVFARQIDGTFGDHNYEITYRRLLNGLALDLTNLERLRYGFFPAVAERGLRIVLFVTPTEGGVLVYSMAIADAPRVPGLTDRIAISFENRLTAVVNWFASELRYHHLRETD